LPDFFTVFDFSFTQSLNHPITNLTTVELLQTAATGSIDLHIGTRHGQIESGLDDSGLFMFVQRV
jgi:hypothetical protein